MHARPIGERRSGEHNRADLFRVKRGHHHDLPPGLTIADQARLALGVRVSGRDLFDKPGLCLADIRDRLTGHRIRQKADKIAGMTCRKSDADLAVMLHAADARTVTGARVEYDEGSFAAIDRSAFGRDHAHQRVIHWAWQRATIEQEFDVEAEHVRRLAGVMLEIVVAALA